MKTKTLREHLLARTERPAVADGLSAMRAELIARVAGGGAASREPESVVDALREGSVLEFFRGAWRELVLPARGVWGGLAAAWLTMLLTDAAGVSASHAVAGGAGRPDAAQVAAQLAVWLEQRRNLAAYVHGQRAGEAIPDHSVPAKPEAREHSDGAKPLSVIENAGPCSWA